MKYRAIIIDDEPLAIRRLSKLLKVHDAVVEIVATAGNGTDAITVIDGLRPDVIFLDIQMPELNGFEVLERINHQPFVIFSTAYDEYALKAFETNSIDYLLKPVDEKRLKMAIEKLQVIKGDKLADFQQQVRKMLEKIRASNARIPVRKGDKIKLLLPGSICFFISEQKYTKVKTYDDSYLIDTPLSILESELDENFVRVHRSVIVNLNYIEEITRMFKGSYRIKIKDIEKSELPVSRHLKHKLGL